MQQSSDKTHFNVTGDNLHSALERLFTETGLTKQQLKQCAQNGAIWITRSANSKPERLRRLKKVLSTQQTIDFYFNPALLAQTPLEPELIDDMGEYSVWLKPRGMLSQGSKWGDSSALYRWVEMNYKPNDTPRQAWIVHRLDRATCGLMLLAHSKKMAASLSRLFEEKKVHKSYKTIVWGQFPELQQRLDNPIDDKPSLSHATRIGYDSSRNLSLVRVDIETGRKHQIRKHLSEFGYPIVGDRLYGNATLDEGLEPKPDLQLSAYKLDLFCPIEHKEKTYVLSHEQLDLLELELE